VISLEFRELRIMPGVTELTNRIQILNENSWYWKHMSNLGRHMDIAESASGYEGSDQLLSITKLIYA